MSGKFQEASGKLPEASGKLPEGSGKLPEDSGKLPEGLGSFQKLPEGLGSFQKLLGSFQKVWEASNARSGRRLLSCCTSFPDLAAHVCSAGCCCCTSFRGTRACQRLHRVVEEGGERRGTALAQQDAAAARPPAALGRARHASSQTCEQAFTGEMRDGLANAWWSRVRDRAEDDGRGFLPRTFWLYPLSAKERRRWSARCLQRGSG